MSQEHRKLTILDGGMGHELKLRGVSEDGTFLAAMLANEKTSTNNDNNIVESIHIEYLDAGCDVITTNSFVTVSYIIEIEGNILTL